jgi:uncharacterized protein (DUF1778 family)
MGKEEPKLPGRPPIGENTQTARVYVRAEDSDKVLFEDAAEAAGISLSEWIRDRLVKAAKRELKRYT